MQIGAGLPESAVLQEVGMCMSGMVVAFGRALHAGGLELRPFLVDCDLFGRREAFKCEFEVKGTNFFDQFGGTRDKAHLEIPTRDAMTLVLIWL